MEHKENRVCPRCSGKVVVCLLYEPRCMYCGWADYAPLTGSDLLKSDKTRMSGTYKAKPCIICGSDISWRIKATKFCADCSELTKLQKNRILNNKAKLYL